MVVIRALRQMSTMRLRRAVGLAALAALLPGFALANGPSIVIDADSGKVIHADRATDPWFPASITKLMTAYVALDLVRQGRASMDQLLTVSEEAHALPPSKMAFKPGSLIRLDNALKIIMVKSANDVAAVIAENLGGSIEGYAALMNDAAARLGMRESIFVNPHGLPDDRQQTSARDMAILARAVYNDFPEYQGLFHIGAIQFGRRVMRNTNGLIGRYPGADGMKTGFICASGFNVVASARRGDRHLITVVLGSPSANQRTLKAAELFDLGFDRTTLFSPGLDSLPASVLQSPPNMRSVICDRRGPMPGEDDSGLVAAAGAETGTGLFSAPNLMAYAGGTLANRTVLGPRAAVQPVQVWLGPNPPSSAELAAQTAAEDAEEKARVEKKGRKGKAVAAKPAADKTAAVDEKPAAEDAKNGKALPAKAAAKDKPVKAVAAKPEAAKPAAAKPEVAKPAAKPATKPQAKPTDKAKPVPAKQADKAKPVPEKQAARPSPKT